MARLFITSKEIALFNDIGKEVIKDIIGQFIYYWPVSTLKTQIHSVYNESLKKIFENPIKIDCLAGQPNWSTTMTKFGPEQNNQLEVYVQSRDLVQKGIEISEGDYFTYGDLAYEIVSYVNINNYFGQVENDIGYKIIGMLTRVGEFNPRQLGEPIDQKNPPENWNQQRGLSETQLTGKTGDVRDTREILGDELPPIALDDGPRKTVIDPSGKANTIYNDND